MAQFGTYTEDGGIVRARDGACIPNDPANRDYQEAMEAVANGDTIAPYVAPTIDYGQIDVDTLNAVLIEQGSVVRALGIVMFNEINKLRVKNGDPAYTLDQFKTALINNMRTS